MMEAHWKRYQQLERENRDLLAALEALTIATDLYHADIQVKLARNQARAAIAAAKGEA